MPSAINQMTLSNVGVLVTRPIAQSRALCEKIHALGGVAWVFPAIEIIPTACTPLQDMLPQLAAADMLIFTSQNAVTYALPLIQAFYPHWPTKPKVGAIGPATAKALDRFGLKVSFSTSKEVNSEGLLSHPDLQQLAHQRVVLFSGEGGRDVLVRGLIEKGADLTKVSVYRRACPKVDVTNIIEIWKSGKIQVVLGTSGEIVVNLQAIFKERAQTLLFSTPLIVASERIYSIAISLGFKKSRLVLAQNASDDAMVNAILRLF